MKSGYRLLRDQIQPSQLFPIIIFCTLDCFVCLQVFGSDSDRLIPVWAWQTGYHDYTRQALEDLGARASTFKALAITSYFSCGRATHLPVGL